MRKIVALLLLLASATTASAQVPISGLPNGGLMQQTDSVPVVRGGVTMKTNPYVWPPSGGVMISNGSSAPASVLPVNGQCLVGGGGQWHSASCATSSGSVTSVTFTGDGIFDSSTPSTAVTTSGSVIATPLQQLANCIFAGPSSGAAASPSCRGLVQADLPALPSSYLWVGNSSNLATGVPLTGDCSIANTGGITCTRTGGVLFGTSATVNTGTSGATIPLLNTANTWSAAQTFSSSDLKLAGSSSGTTILNAAATASGTLTLPAATDTLIARATTDTLTNKTFDTAGTGNVFKINGNQLSTVSGNTSVAATASGTLTAGDCVNIDSNGNFKDAGGACTVGGGGGTVNSGTAGQLPYYATSTNAVTSNANITISSGKLTLGQATSVIGQLALSGSTSGTTTLTPAVTATGTLTLPSATDTLVGRATTDTLTNKSIAGSEVNSGTLPASVLPTPTASTLGGIESITSASNNFVTFIDTSGVPHQAQPAFSNISGSVASGQLPLATSGAVGGIQGDGSTLTISGGGVASCTTATSSQIGCSKPDGTILTIAAGAETVATATSLAKGVVQTDGSTITNSTGTISCTTATGSQIGCAKFGTGLSVTAGNVTNNGVISLTGDGVVTGNSGTTGAAVISLLTHTANTVLAGPTSGSAATPTFRALTTADMPTLDKATTTAFARASLGGL